METLAQMPSDPGFQQGTKVPDDQQNFEIFLID